MHYYAYYHYMVEAASPNFKVDKVLGKNLIIDIQVVAPNQSLALRTILITSTNVNLIPVIECQYRFRDSTWEYLRKKALTDFIKDIIFENDKTNGYRIGLAPSTIVVNRITVDNMADISNKILSLV